MNEIEGFVIKMVKHGDKDYGKYAKQGGYTEDINQAQLFKTETAAKKNLMLFDEEGETIVEVLYTPASIKEHK